MAKEDFCFTYYDGDAARDKAHMTRLCRGAYDDLISMQRKVGHLDLDAIQMVLSSDFDQCWKSLIFVLKKDELGKYFIEWVDKSLEKMRANSEKQKENALKRWGKESAPTRSERMINARNKGTHIKEDWDEMKSFFKTCVCCENSDNVYPDHVFPVSIGGGDGIENLQPLCALCNSKKAKKYIDFRPGFCKKHNLLMPSHYKLMPSHIEIYTKPLPLENGDGDEYVDDISLNINIAFEEFWNAYDKKIGEKEKLKTKWEKLTDPVRQNIMDYIPKYKQAQPDKSFRKNPETFLNNKSWNDELISKTHARNHGKSTGAHELLEELRKIGG